jgi:hypothetical protein
MSKRERGTMRTMRERERDNESKRERVRVGETTIVREKKGERMAQ